MFKISTLVFLLSPLLILAHLWFHFLIPLLSSSLGELLILCYRAAQLVAYESHSAHRGLTCSSQAVAQTLFLELLLLPLLWSLQVLFSSWGGPMLGGKAGGRGLCTDRACRPCTAGSPGTARELSLHWGDPGSPHGEAAYRPQPLKSWKVLLYAIICAYPLSFPLPQPLSCKNQQLWYYHVIYWNATYRIYFKWILNYLNCTILINFTKQLGTGKMIPCRRIGGICTWANTEWTWDGKKKDYYAHNTEIKKHCL